MCASVVSSRWPPTTWSLPTRLTGQTMIRRFVSIRQLTIQADALGYLQGHGLVLPLIGLDGPKILCRRNQGWSRKLSTCQPARAAAAPAVKIGDLRITDGDAHIVIPRMKSDFNAQIASEGEGNDARIVVDAKGTYAAQPITGHLVGGALLSLRDADHPWPVDLDAGQWSDACRDERAR